MSSLYSLGPHSHGLKLKPVVTKIAVHTHTHTHTHFYYFIMPFSRNLQPPCNTCTATTIQMFGVIKIFFFFFFFKLILLFSKAALNWSKMKIKTFILLQKYIFQINACTTVFNTDQKCFWASNSITLIIYILEYFCSVVEHKRLLSKNIKNSHQPPKLWNGSVVYMVFTIIKCLISYF